MIVFGLKVEVQWAQSRQGTLLPRNGEIEGRKDRTGRWEMVLYLVRAIGGSLTRCAYLTARLIA